MVLTSEFFFLTRSFSIVLPIFVVVQSTSPFRNHYKRVFFCTHLYRIILLYSKGLHVLVNRGIRSGRVPRVVIVDGSGVVCGRRWRRWRRRRRGIFTVIPGQVLSGHHVVVGLHVEQAQQVYRRIVISHRVSLGRHFISWISIFYIL